MNRKEKYGATALSKSDRKVLDKYTKYYSNFIESNTAKTVIHEEERFKGKH
ncbi:MAG: hypothetical protein GX383_01605 [Clostridium sp.]|mgnify:CR=1 FL=1|jgi:hypothetical protein|nr:hypothetical protein [Clostridium sp.]